ncbi:MAG: stage III sporulation protein AG [Lachnospiraceae bacterium]|nr:stage III sporulation protein AG [Lachnospiraceae bacterium]
MKEKWNLWRKKYWPPGKDKLLILVLFGLLLAVIAIPVEEKKEESGGQEAASAKEQTESQSQSYEEQMEAKLQELLGAVEGVGEVKVMLTFEGSSEKEVEKDVSLSGEDESQETVYEEHSGSERTPYVTSEKNPKVAGVLVIAQGGGSSRIRQEILEAAQALFGIDAHKIKIMKMEGTK